MTTRNWLALFKQFSTEFSSIGFFSHDGSSLLLKSNFLPDFATLGEALSTVRKTLNPKYPQICILNDPQFGGALLSTCTFIFQLGREPNSPWVVCRSSAKELPRLKNIWSEESLKLPPLPLPTTESEQLSFIAGISGHPLAPTSWSCDLPEILKTIHNLRTHWDKNFSLKWKKDFSDLILKDTQKWLKLKLENASNLEIEEKLNFITQIQLAKPSCLKIKVQLEKMIVAIDFTGTSLVDSGLPPLWTQGVVLGIFNQFIKAKNPDIVFGNLSANLHLISTPRSFVNQQQLKNSQADWLVAISAITQLLQPSLARIFNQSKAEPEKKSLSKFFIFQLSSNQNPKAHSTQTITLAPFETHIPEGCFAKLTSCERGESVLGKRAWKIIEDCDLQCWYFLETSQQFPMDLNSTPMSPDGVSLSLKKDDVISFG